MRRNRLFKMFTSAVLTGAMVLSMGGMTAFAATAENPLTSATLTKEVITDGKTFAPNTEFHFSITGGEATTYSSNPVFAGQDGDLTIAYREGKTGIVFTPSMTTVPSEKYEGEATINISRTFSEPGIYHYVLTESDDGYEGIQYDTTSRDLYVYVERADDDTLFVSGMIAVKGDDVQNAEPTEGKTGLTITNNYGADGNDSTHDVIITKNVTGNQGDRTHPFTFKVSVATSNEEDANELYYVEYGTVENGVFTLDESKEATVIDSADENPTTITLSHDQAIRINGLSAGDRYTVEEVDNNGDLNGYATSIVGAASDGRKVENAALNADATQVKYTNDKNITTPTGIALTFAPYLLMVALAGVFAVLFLRRRREEF